jgi:hypothetical protein
VTNEKSGSGFSSCPKPRFLFQLGHDCLLYLLAVKAGVLQEWADALAARQRL